MKKAHVQPIKTLTLWCVKVVVSTLIGWYIVVIVLGWLNL